MESVRIGLCGLGTVGTGVVSLLQRNAEIIAGRIGRPLELVAVASRTPKPDVNLGSASFGTDVFELARRPDIDVIVETIGGETIAVELMETALRQGKSVVTANKAAIALQGNALSDVAVEHGAHLSFEAAVAGGIPIIDVLRQGLAANRIDWLAGIINGTSNYILTAMAEQGESFDAALEKAQALGYAEADPTFDVEGIDAAHKLTIMAALGFDAPFEFSHVYTEGISKISVEDIAYARQLGYRIKHLGIARNTGSGIELRVHPTLVPESQLLAGVDGVMNAVVVHGDAVGSTLYYGAGAGAGATASSVVANLIQIARGAVPAPAPAQPVQMLPIQAVETACYLRVPLSDRPGVMARVTNTLSDHGISIEALIQREEAIHAETVGEPWVPVVILTQRVAESRILDALSAIRQLDGVVGEIIRIRVETLDE